MYISFNECYYMILFDFGYCSYFNSWSHGQKNWDILFDWLFVYFVCPYFPNRWLIPDPILEFFYVRVIRGFLWFLLIWMRRRILIFTHSVNDCKNHNLILCSICIFIYKKLLYYLDQCNFVSKSWSIYVTKIIPMHR